MKGPPHLPLPRIILCLGFIYPRAGLCEGPRSAVSRGEQLGPRGCVAAAEAALAPGVPAGTRIQPGIAPGAPLPSVATEPCLARSQGLGSQQVPEVFLRAPAEREATSPTFPPCSRAKWDPLAVLTSCRAAPARSGGKFLIPALAAQPSPGAAPLPPGMDAALSRRGREAAGTGEGDRDPSPALPQASDKVWCKSQLFSGYNQAPSSAPAGGEQQWAQGGYSGTAGPVLPAGTFPPCQASRCHITRSDTKCSWKHRKPQELSRAEQQPGGPQLRGSHRAMPKPTVPPAAIARPSPSRTAAPGTGTAQAPAGGATGFEPPPEVLSFLRASPSFHAKPKAPTRALRGVLRAQTPARLGAPPAPPHSVPP